MNRFLRRMLFIVLGRQLVMFLLSRRPNIRELGRQFMLLILSMATSALIGWLLIEAEQASRRKLALSSQRVLPKTGADDLTIIDGIGPTYARALNELGIKSFADLACQDPAELSRRMRGRVSATRIRNQDWIGQAVQLSRQ